MTGKVTNDPPGRIGPVGSGWSIELDAMPHNPSQSSGSTGSASFTAVATPEAHLTMNNYSKFEFVDDFAPEDPQAVKVASVSWEQVDNPLNFNDGGHGEGPYGGGYGAGYGGIVWGQGNYGSGNGYGKTAVSLHFPPDPEGVISATVEGSIDSVSLSGETGTFTQGTQFTQFAISDVKIPSVSSGSPLGAINLAWQIAGNNPCSFTDEKGVYWSLRGHDSGFDYQGKIVEPIDHSTHKMLTDTAIYRQWNVQDSYASSKWASHSHDLWSVAGIGSSLVTDNAVKNIIIGTTMLDNPQMPFVFNLGTSLSNFGFGPNYASKDYGKFFSLSITQTGASLTGSYYSGGQVVNVSKTAQLTGIDITQPVQFAIAVGFQSAKVMQITAYITNFPDIDGVSPVPVVLATGQMITAKDLSPAPWSHTGYLQDLYVTQAKWIVNPEADSYLGDYVTWPNYPHCDLDNFGVGSPILAYSGTLWDYLAQVCVARQVDLRLVGGRFTLTAMNDNAAPQSWTPVASPTFAIDNSTTAATVEIDAQFTAKVSANQVVYDGQKDTNTYSVTPGTTTTFTITTTSANALVYNPAPVDGYATYLNGNHPYGAYVVSGPDNLPVLAAEWVSYGGSLSVEQTDVNTLTVTVVCPVIPLGSSNDLGSYTIGVSDGSTTYSLLKLVSVAGGQSTAYNVVYQTGASYIGSNTSGSSVSNVAATDQQSLANLAAWAVAEAAGPHLTLSGEFPLEDLRGWADHPDFGLVPGTTILYRNVQWRILTATLSSLGVSFTAEPYTLYSSPAFSQNWDNLTVDDFTSFWEGKTYDDMATMLLSGPMYDWGPDGAITRFTQYPSAGESLVLDLGIDPSTTLLPSPLLDPDTPSVLYTGAVFPDSTTYSGTATYPLFPTSILPALWASPGEFPGSDEE